MKPPITFILKHYWREELPRLINALLRALFAAVIVVVVAFVILFIVLFLLEPYQLMPEDPIPM